MRGTLHETLFYGPEGDGNELTFASDASFAPEASRSRSGGCIQYAGSVIHWYSTRQTVTAWSVCEAETDGLAEALSQGIRILYVLKDLLHKDLQGCLTGDNSASIILAGQEKMDFGKWRTRAFALRCSWCRDQLHLERIPIRHTPGQFLVADLLTKILPKTRLKQLREMAGVRPAGSE